MSTKAKKTKKVTAKKKFWAFKALANNEGELTIYGEIADSQSWWGDGGEVTPKGFKEELDALGDITTLNVYMNSGGGDVFAGQAIYSQLKRHKATVNMHIDGLAASIASVIAMAGDTIHMPANAMMMIHHPMSGVWGNANEMRTMADTLDKVCESIQETYLAKATDLEKDKLVELLDAETWLTAQECLDLGLCDVMDEEMAIAASIRDFEILAKYKNTPKLMLSTISTERMKAMTPPNGTGPNCIGCQQTNCANCPCQCCKATDCTNCPCQDCAAANCKGCPCLNCESDCTVCPCCKCAKENCLGCNETSENPAMAPDEDMQMSQKAKALALLALECEL